MCVCALKGGRDDALLQRSKKFQQQVGRYTISRSMIPGESEYIAESHDRGSGRVHQTATIAVGHGGVQYVAVGNCFV